MPEPVVSPIADTFRDVENLLYHICHQFSQKHGGDIDDHISTAHQVYMDVYRTWKEGYAPFSNYVATCLYRRLLMEKQRQRRIPVMSISQEDGDYEIEDLNQSSFLELFLNDLSDDSKLVIQLIFETPDEIQSLIDGKGGSPRNIRSTIKEYLRKTGWTFTRITESFEEIRQALQ